MCIRISVRTWNIGDAISYCLSTENLRMIDGLSLGFSLIGVFGIVIGVGCIGSMVAFEHYWVVRAVLCFGISATAFDVATLL